MIYMLVVLLSVAGNITSSSTVIGSAIVSYGSVDFGQNYPVGAS